MLLQLSVVHLSVMAVNFFLALSFTTLGSILGFAVMFYIGSTVDRRVVQSGKYRFVPVNAIDKVELVPKVWLLCCCRKSFLPGTRAVISFFAGISNLDAKKTIALCGLSALLWNLYMLYLGFVFGDNVEWLINT